jgi:LPS sulfotransferase NodH
MTKAIILTTQRTGSTFLVESLHSHPEVHCVGEMLAGGHIRDSQVPGLVFKSRYSTKAYRYLTSGAVFPTRMMDRYFARDDRPVMAFKAMYNQISPPWTLRYLREHTEIRVLHLRRHNLLKQYVSHALIHVKRDDHWDPHTTQPVKPASIVISADDALRYLRRLRAEHDAHERMFVHHPRLSLTYESMIDGNALATGVARDICNFLGISQQPMHSKLVKLNPELLREMITNYDEVSRRIRQTEFADLLD